MKFKKEKTFLDTVYDAQIISFAPIIFQATKVMRDAGILNLLEDKGDEGLTPAQISDKSGISKYGVEVLLDSASSVGIVEESGGSKYIITELGEFILNDEITRINMDFVNDVCYKGMFHLEEAIKEEKPAGLKVFGDWKTIYHSLSSLPSYVQKSWFKFDQYYSDYSFPKAVKMVMKNNPKNILDVGGNTGKWALTCVKNSDKVSVTIMDLPGQLEKAKKYIDEHGYENRVNYIEADLLDQSKPFPKGFDIIWMSQFLVCFSEEEIKGILRRACDALDNNSYLYIMDTFIDKQRFPAAKLCLQNTSLYFTCMANGNSRMYYSKDMIRLLEEEGFVIEKEINNVGIAHTLLKCKKN